MPSGPSSLPSQPARIDIADCRIEDLRPDGIPRHRAGRLLHVVAVDLSLDKRLLQSIPECIKSVVAAFPVDSLVVVVGVAHEQLHLYEFSEPELVCVHKLVQVSDSALDFFSAVEFQSLCLHVGTKDWQEKLSKALLHLCKAQAQNTPCGLEILLAPLLNMVSKKRRVICGTSLLMFANSQLFSLPTDKFSKELIRNAIRLVAFIPKTQELFQTDQEAAQDDLHFSRIVSATNGDVFLLDEKTSTASDLIWTLSQSPVAVDCLIRIRASEGLECKLLHAPVNRLEEYVDIGSIPSLLNDTTLALELEYASLEDLDLTTVQIALSYSSPPSFERRLRVFTIQLTPESNFDAVFRSADVAATSYLVLRRTLGDIVDAGIVEARLRLAEWLVCSASQYAASEVKGKNGEVRAEDISVEFSQNLAGLTEAALALCNSPVLHGRLPPSAIGILVVWMSKAVPGSAELISPATPHSRGQLIHYEEFCKLQRGTGFTFSAFREEVLNTLAEIGVRIGQETNSPSLQDSASGQV